jgi:hypothetical protein
MDWNEIPHDPSHQGVTSGASKTFLSKWYIRRKACTYLASRLERYPNRLNRASTWASSPMSTIGGIQNNFWAYDSLMQTLRLSCNDTNTVSKWTKTRLHMTPSRSSSGASKMICEPLLRSAQIKKLCCVKISTISKRNETSIHLSLVS